MSEQQIKRDKWYAFVQGFFVGFATLGMIAVELTGWLFLAILSMSVALLLFGYLVIGLGGGEGETQ